jgi:hypothetical protein
MSPSDSVMADSNAFREPPMSPDHDDPEPVRVQGDAFAHSAAYYGVRALASRNTEV